MRTTAATSLLGNKPVIHSECILAIREFDHFLLGRCYFSNSNLSAVVIDVAEGGGNVDGSGERCGAGGRL